MYCAVVVQVKKAPVSGRTTAAPLPRTPLSDISNVQVLLMPPVLVGLGLLFMSHTHRFVRVLQLSCFQW